VTTIKPAENRSNSASRLPGIFRFSGLPQLSRELATTSATIGALRQAALGFSGISRENRFKGSFLSKDACLSQETPEKQGFPQKLCPGLCPGTGDLAGVNWE
jgi:hypothetical protein